MAKKKQRKKPLRVLAAVPDLGFSRQQLQALKTRFKNTFVTTVGEEALARRPVNVVMVQMDAPKLPS